MCVKSLHQSVNSRTEAARHSVDCLKFDYRRDETRRDVPAFAGKDRFCFLEGEFAKESSRGTDRVAATLPHKFKVLIDTTYNHITVGYNTVGCSKFHHTIALKGFNQDGGCF